MGLSRPFPEKCRFARPKFEFKIFHFRSRLVSRSMYGTYQFVGYVFPYVPTNKSFLLKISNALRKIKTESILCIFLPLPGYSFQYNHQAIYFQRETKQFIPVNIVPCNPLQKRRLVLYETSTSLMTFKTNQFSMLLL